MNTTSSNNFDDAIANINIARYRLSYLEYMLKLKFYMDNLSNEMLKFQKNIFDLSLSDNNRPDSYVYVQTDDLIGSLIEPIEIINQLIESEMRSYGKVFKQEFATESN